MAGLFDRIIVVYNASNTRSDGTPSGLATIYICTPFTPVINITELEESTRKMMRALESSNSNNGNIIELLLHYRVEPETGQITT